MDSRAPNFNGAYPLAGERIGPAWEDLWYTLSDKRWIEAKPFAQVIADRHELNIHTVMGLMSKAKAAGILMSVRMNVPGKAHKVVHYRVSPDHVG